MLDLKPYYKVLEQLNSGNLTVDGKINFACWLGERAYRLVAEIERLQAQQRNSADTNPCEGYGCKTEMRPFTLHDPKCPKCR